MRRAPPTKGLRKLINYYKGRGPSIAKLKDFLGDLVFDSSKLTDDLVRARFEASIDPEVIASPPLQGPPNLAAALRMDFTRDRRLSSLSHATLVLWGADDRVNRASGGRDLVKRIPNGDLCEFSNTGHWVQWERPAEFNALTMAFLEAGQ
jgi:4,5:9,10-diseco-3-hydroxy-5,9,17-trioxoandrosta-1(10),2-diene-4-oate hydrolase